MTDLWGKCAVCGALLDEEDLFCANCGTEAPAQEGKDERPGSVNSKFNFLCDGCGAAMSYDASAQNLRCPFCGSEQMTAEKDAKVLAPNRVVPFAIDRPQADAIMRGWLSRGFWRPRDLASAATVEKMSPVYVPYWVFQARTFTYWTADSSVTPPGASAEWYPVFGEHRGSYRGLVIGASGALTPQETSTLCPFDLSQGVPLEQVDLQNVVVEQFRVQRKYARPFARQGLEQLESDACRGYVKGRARNLQVNMRLEGLSSEPLLLPVWIVTYGYRDEPFRFLINGQSGEPTGIAPVSMRKILAAVAIVSVALIIFALLAMALAR